MIIQIIYNFKVGGEVSSWSVTERNGSSGEPMASRCWSGAKVALHELTEHPPFVSHIYTYSDGPYQQKWKLIARGSGGGARAPSLV